MSRKQKPPPKKPSKAYLVSFGDTMTALLAFFIVLNSLSKDQTGANMYAGTGSFVQAMKSIGLQGSSPGDRSDQIIVKTDATPVYAVDAEKTDPGKSQGPDETDDNQRVISRESDNFQRFLSEMEYQFQVHESAPTQSQIVFDSFENLGGTDDPNILGNNAIQLAADAISQLGNEAFELEVIVWAKMPSPLALQRSMDQAIRIEQQLDRSFVFRGNQRQRLTVSAKPWLFVDAKRPRISFVLSRLDK